MGNFETFKKMRAEFNSGQHLGSAERENAQYVDSVAGKLNHLKEVWVSISQTMISSDFTKGLLDGAIKVSEAIDMITKGLDKVGMLTPTLTAVGVTMASMVKTMVSNSKNNFSLLAPRATNGLVTTFKRDITSATGLINKFKAVGETAYTAVGNGFLNMGKGISKALKFMGSFALQAVGIMAVTMAVQAGVKAWDEYAHGVENARKKIQESIDSKKEDLTNSKTKLDSFDGNKDRYSELLEKQKAYVKSGQKLNDEQKADMNELVSMQKELADTFPELVIGKNSEGNPILSMAGDADGLIAKLEKAVEVKERLLDSDENELAKNATTRMQDGEKWNDPGLIKNLENQKNAYKKNLKDIHIEQLTALNAVQGATGKGREGALKIIQEYYDKEKALNTKHYDEQLKAFQDQSTAELEIQNGNFNKLQTRASNYKKLEGENKSFMEQFSAQINWGSMDESKQNATVDFIDKVSELTAKGNPKVKEWTESWNKANEEFAVTNDKDKYAESLTGIAKGFSELTGTDFSTVMMGLTQMTAPLDPAQQKLQNFLSTYKKSLLDLDSGDAIATKLAEQFSAVERTISQLNNIDNQVNGAIKIDLMAEMSKDENLPQEIRDFAKGAVADATVEPFEHDAMVALNMLYEQGEDGFEEEYAKIQKILDGEASKSEMNMPIKIGEVTFDSSTLQSLDGWNKKNKGKEITMSALCDVEGIADLEKLNTAIDKTRDSIKGGEITTKFLTEVVGEDKAQLYLDMIQKLKMSPEMTNKFILENGEALSKMKNIEEVKKFLQENPDIVNKYNIQGIEKIDEAKEKKKELEKNGEAETKVKVTEEGVKETKEDVEELDAKVKSADSKELEVKANSKQVIDSIDDIETLIKYSTKMKDGAYKLDIQANTENAVNSLEQLEIALKKVSNVMTNSPTMTFRADTAQASQNVTGLRTNVEKMQGIMSKNTNLVFHSDTAQASKNITGLINNANRCMALKPKTIKFNSDTAQASKNITGLINKINSVPTGTKTIRYNVVTAYSTSGSPTPQSSETKIKKFLGMSSNDIPKQQRAIINNPQLEVMKTLPQSSGTQVSTPILQSPTPPNITFGGQTTEGVSSPQVQSNPINGVMRASSDMTRKISNSMAKDTFKFDIDAFKELENSLKKISNELDVIDKKMESSFGQEKINYLQRQVILLKEQQKIQHKLAEDMRVQKDALKSDLQNKGFTFDGDDNVSNYNEKLLAYEKHVKSLEDRVSADKDGKNEKLKAEYDASKQDLDEMKKALDSYLNLTFSEIPNASKEWLELNNTIKETEKAIKDAQIALKFADEEVEIERYKTSLASLGRELELLENQIENMQGQDKLNAMDKRLELLRKEQDETHKLANAYRNVQTQVQEYLSSKGFMFDEGGEVQNYEFSATFIGTENYDELKDALEEYNKLKESVSDLSEEWWKVEGAIGDCINEANKLAIAIKNADAKINVGKYETSLNSIRRQITRLDEDIDRAFGKEKDELIKKKIDLIRQEQAELHKLANAYRDQAGVLKENLANNGFTFDEEGTVTNLENIKNLMDKKDYESIKEALEEYIKLTQDEIPDLSEEWWDLEDSIEDILKTQLETTKDVQDKISEIYKKKVEERKKLIDEELKKRLDALNKEKEAYNKSREEADYKSDYEDQSDVIAKLQEKLDIASKDTSLSGQKKLQELMKQLEAEQKKLQEMVQDKIDSDINDMFDKESDRLESEADKSKEDLDDKYSDEKLQEIIDKTLSTGIFEDINGDLHNLQDVMVDYINKYEDGMSAIGGIIKSEWITNLETAKETMKDMADILKELNLQDVVGGVTTRFTQDSRYTPTPYEKPKNIEFNKPLIVVEGNVDKDVMVDLEKMALKVKKDVMSELASSSR